MKNACKLRDLVRDIDDLSVDGSGEVSITGVTSDSRAVRPGMIFAAIPGASHDGRAYIADALDKGAAGILMPEPGMTRRPDALLLTSRNVRKTFALLASAFYENPSRQMNVVGITGTNGKTTVAWLADFLFRACGRKTSLLGTIECRVGERVIPAKHTTAPADELQALMHDALQAGCEDLLMEVSSHALVQDRVGGTRFAAAVFTNLSHEHLDYHGDMETYFAAKAELFQGADDSTCIINTDDPWGLRLAAELKGKKILRYGLSRDAEVRAENIAESMEGLEFDLCSPWGRYPVRSAMLCRFNLYNLLAALALAGERGLDLEKVCTAAAEFSGAPGRLERIPDPSGRCVLVDYAHTPDALHHVLGSLTLLKEGQLILVVGCGGDRDRDKRPEMGKIAEQYADMVVITSDNARTEDPESIAGDILRGMKNPTSAHVILDRREALKFAVEKAAPHDMVIAAGKGHESTQTLGRRVVTFDDRTELKCLLEEMYV